MKEETIKTGMKLIQERDHAKDVLKEFLNTKDKIKNIAFLGDTGTVSGSRNSINHTGPNSDVVNHLILQYAYFLETKIETISTKIKELK